MKKIKIAAILMIFHGGVIEVEGCLALLILMLYANASITSPHFMLSNGNSLKKALP